MRRRSALVAAVAVVMMVAALGCVVADSSAAATAAATAEAAAAAAGINLHADLRAGRCMQPREQIDLRRTLDNMDEEQVAQLRAEAAAYDKAFAARAPLPPRPKGAGPDWSQVGPFVKKLMECRGVSGVSLAVVQGGKMVWSEGFGVQSVASQTPVNTDTLFGIGSCSKAFTASLGAILEKDGVFSMDDPVVSHLPDYRLMDKNQVSSLTWNLACLT